MPVTCAWRQQQIGSKARRDESLAYTLQGPCKAASLQTSLHAVSYLAAKCAPLSRDAEALPNCRLVTRDLIHLAMADLEALRTFMCNEKEDEGTPSLKLLHSKANTIFRALTSRQGRFLCLSKKGLEQKAGRTIPWFVWKQEDTLG